MILTQEILKSIVTYHPDTGTWTNNRTGKQVGYLHHPRPEQTYVRLRVGQFGPRYSHRLAVLWMTGEWPPCKVDHIDQNSLNNAWENLRLANNAQNQWNLKVPADHPTGVRGVRWDARYNSYAVELRAGGLRVFKRFKRFEDAKAARLEAQQRYHRW
jgi:hypothetical protein